METADLANISQQAMVLLVTIVAPPVLAGLTVGLAVAVFQTATQIQEQNVGFAARATAVIASLLVAGPWIGQRLSAFATELFQLLESVQLQ